jgi:hypothetical protein
MHWKRIVGALLLVTATVIVVRSGTTANDQGKYAVILQAGHETHEGMARAVHAFLYARELDERGYDVVVIFDGAGTEWAAELTNPESTSPLKKAYAAFKTRGITEIICDFCANAFDVHGALVERQQPLIAEYAGHPSIVKWIERGYQLIVL